MEFHLATEIPKSERITHIMDTDGFMVNGHFLCKDLAIIASEHNVNPTSASFRLRRRFHEIPRKDQVSAIYVRNHVHGLPFKDIGVEPYEQCEIGKVVKSITDFSSSTVVAYKGGHIERDLLTSIGIPSVNLEDLGCPKYDALIHNPQYRELDKVGACRLHQAVAGTKRTNTGAYHCPSREVVAFNLWYQRYLEQASTHNK